MLEKIFSLNILWAVPWSRWMPYCFTIHTEMVVWIDKVGGVAFTSHNSCFCFCSVWKYDLIFGTWTRNYIVKSSVFVTSLCLQHHRECLCSYTNKSKRLTIWRVKSLNMNLFLSVFYYISEVLCNYIWIYIFLWSSCFLTDWGIEQVLLGYIVLFSCSRFFYIFLCSEVDSYPTTPWWKPTLIEAVTHVGDRFWAIGNWCPENLKTIVFPR